LKEPGAHRRTLTLWLAGFAAMLAGFAWSRVFPINKNLWTSSFALFSAGLAAQTIAICHLLIDTLQWRAWSRPLAAFGRNTLAAYFLSVGFDAVLTRWRVADGSLKSVLYRVGFASWLRPCCGAEAASLGYALAYVAVWGVVLFELHRRRIFIGI
jgi:predicted acyltransferase